MKREKTLNMHMFFPEILCRFFLLADLQKCKCLMFDKTFILFIFERLWVSQAGSGGDFFSIYQFYQYKSLDF